MLHAFYLRNMVIFKFHFFIYHPNTTNTSIHLTLFPNGSEQKV